MSDHHLELFFRKVNKMGRIPRCNPALGNCWEWESGIDRLGYGSFKVSGLKTISKSHTISYLHFVGDVPDGLELDHLCRNRSCCNPAHLEPVTHRENMRRGNAARTYCPNGHAFTTENTVISSKGWKMCLDCKPISEAKRKARHARKAKVAKEKYRLDAEYRKNKQRIGRESYERNKA